MALDGRAPLGKLRGEQLARSGRVIERLRAAGFTDEDAAVVVKASFFSTHMRSRLWLYVLEVVTLCARGCSPI